MGLLYLRLGENFKAFDYLGPPPLRPFDGLPPPPLTPYRAVWTVHNKVSDLAPHPLPGVTALVIHPSQPLSSSHLLGLWVFVGVNLNGSKCGLEILVERICADEFLADIAHSSGLFGLLCSTNWSQF